MFGVYTRRAYFVNIMSSLADKAGKKGQPQFETWAAFQAQNQGFSREMFSRRLKQVF